MTNIHPLFHNFTQKNASKFEALFCVDIVKKVYANLYEISTRFICKFALKFSI